MDDQARWLGAAAEILNAPGADLAHDLFVTLLQQQTRAGLVSRVILSADDPDALVMTVEGYLPYPPKEFWPRAAEVRKHPINLFHADTGDHEPVLMTDVIAAGWPVDAQSREIMDGLGLTEQQLSIPVAASSADYNGWVLIAEDAFDPDAAERMTDVHALIVGLSRHIGLLEQARTRLGAAPAPDSVRLTPREQVVLSLVRDGHTVTGVANRLAISPRTVHKHQENLYRKLGAVDRLSAVLAAQRLGILPQDPEPLPPELP